MIQLTHGDWALSVRPDIGAAITRLTWRGRDVLRPAPQGARGPLETGSFPLIPYANRIDRAAFAFEGRQIALPPTPGFEPHAIHGVGWRRPWKVLDGRTDAVDLALATEASSDWPWAWSASHSLRLNADGLEMTLGITNKDVAPMPAGLGFHPYFQTGPGTVLTVSAGRVWANGTDQIPERLVPATEVMDWSEGATVTSAPFVDNAYADWSGQASIVHSEHEVRMSASSNARWVQIYAPNDTGFVCIEPVTHRPNAHNAPAEEDAGLVVLTSGQTLSMSMRIDAVPIGDHP